MAAPAPASADAVALATDADRLAHVRAHWAGIEPHSPIYGLFFKDIAIQSAADGRVVARLPLALIHVNSKHILHGAVSAALVDWAGGMAIASQGRTKTGVSTDIHVSYVSAARAGDTLEIEAWVQKAGRMLAFTSVEIRKAVDGGGGGKGVVVASGSHTKYVGGGPSKPAQAGAGQ